jgi:tetratricopeptide (TPR) repeat protein
MTDTVKAPVETSNIEVKLSESKLEQQGEIKVNGEKDEKLVEAEKYKDEGNVAFKEQNYAKAIELYTIAIEYNPNEASYYGNRSFAYIKSEFYGICFFSDD